MRFQHPYIGSRRQKQTFLLFPKRVGCQTRWLEWGRWEELCVWDGFGRRGKWEPQFWTDEEERER